MLFPSIRRLILISSWFRRRFLFIQDNQKLKNTQRSPSHTHENALLTKRIERNIQERNHLSKGKNPPLQDISLSRKGKNRPIGYSIQSH